MKIEVLPPYRSTKYLGRKLQFSEYHKTEVENRISGAWRKFHLLKQELTGRSYSINNRIRLFQGTITPTMLHGCETWTVTQELENRIRRTQRQMLRMIIRTPRRKKLESSEADPRRNPDGDNDGDYPENDDSSITTGSGGDVHSGQPLPAADADQFQEEDTLEPWPDWIRRATQQAEHSIPNFVIADWSTTVKQRKWKLLQEVCTDSAKEWAQRVLQSEPQNDAHIHTQRRVGRQKTRWWDDILSYIKRCVEDAPQHVAGLLRLAGTDTWDNLESGYTQQ
jgi:hypothetical protein